MIKHHFFAIKLPEHWGADAHRQAGLRKNHTTWIGAMSEVARISKVLPPTCTCYERPLEGAQVKTEYEKFTQSNGEPAWAVTASLPVENMVQPASLKTHSIVGGDGMTYTREERTPPVWMNKGFVIHETYMVHFVTIEVQEASDIDGSVTGEELSV